MYKALRKAYVSLAAAAVLFFLFAAPGLARDRYRDRGDARQIIGLDVVAKQGGDRTLGRVDDVTFDRGGNINEVIVGLYGSNREIAVPRDSLIIHRDYVSFVGTPDELYAMAPAENARGYYRGDRGYNDRYDRGYNNDRDHGTLKNDFDRLLGK